MKSHEIKEMVRCEHCGNIYLIPADLFARVIMNIDILDKKYVRYKTGAMLYDMSERQFMDIAKDAKATVKINRMVLVDLKKLDRYLECFVSD